jgi:lipoic acid synthetase
VIALAPKGLTILRLEVRNAEIPIELKQSGIRAKAKMGPDYTAVQGLVKAVEGRGPSCP